MLRMLIYIKAGPLICALFEIQTMVKFRWVGGLEIRVFFKLGNEKIQQNLKLTRTFIWFSGEISNSVHHFLDRCTSISLRNTIALKVCAFISHCCSNWRVGGLVILNPNIVRILKSAQINGHSLIFIYWYFIVY